MSIRHLPQAVQERQRRRRHNRELQARTHRDAVRKVFDRSLWRRILTENESVRALLPRLYLLSGASAALLIVQAVLLGVILDRILTGSTRLVVGILILMLIAVGLAACLCNRLASRLSTRMAGLMMDHLLGRLFQGLHRAPLGFFTHAETGKVANQFIIEVPTTRDLYQGQIPVAVADLCTVLFALIASFLVDWRIGLLVGGFVILTSPLCRNLNTRGVLASLQEQEAGLQLSGFVNEHVDLQSALMVRQFDLLDTTKARLHELSDQYSSAQSGRIKMLSAISETFSLAAVGALALAILVFTEVSANPSQSIGAFVIMFSLIRALQLPLTRLWSVTRFQVARGLIAFESVLSLLEWLEKPEQHSVQRQGEAAKENSSRYVAPAVSCRQGTGHAPVPSPLGAEVLVRFENVTHAFPPAHELVPPAYLRSHDPDEGEAAVLHEVSFEISSGAKVAVVGPTGGGKSTLGLVAAGLLSPSSGVVRYGTLLSDDGVTLRPRAVSYVAQDAVLFHGTIRENLLLANPNATEKEMIAACIAARLHTSVRAFPKGYNTIVGARGFRLSGGERQRLSIARALLARSPLIVLDEPTAHLDLKTEAELEQHLRDSFSGCGRLVIAHRLSTIRAADQILVMDHGRVVERGTHESLLASGGAYARLLSGPQMTPVGPGGRAGQGD